MPDLAGQQRIIAAVDLVGRSGARALEFGYLHDDVPVDLAGWWAHATWQGARIMVDDQPGPAEALEALARSVLTGATCQGCKRPVVIDSVALGSCRWYRSGARWLRACGPISTPEDPHA
jgi:hypothetical protein